MPRGMIDVDIPYGEDLTLQPNGDPVLVIDTTNAPDATQQWVVRLLCTSPRLRDDLGNVIGRADNLFFPEWGAGLPAVVGESDQPAVEDAISTAILQALAQSAYILPDPLPAVSVSFDSGGLTVGLRCISVTGDIVSIPQLPLTKLGA